MKTAALETPAPAYFAPPARSRRIMTTELAFNCVRIVFMALAPIAVCGVCVGATAIVLTQADPALHRTFVAIVWSAAVLISTVIVGGIVLLGKQFDWRD